MAIEDLLLKSTDLPDYKLVGYVEIGVPIFKRILHCLLLQQKNLHVVEEFVLRLTEHNLSLIEITDLLGLDQQLVEASWFNLISMGFIDPLDKVITELGTNYLQDNKIDSYEKTDIPVSIDGLTGEIKVDRNWISAQNIRELGIQVVDPYIEIPDKEDLINFSEVNNVLHALNKDEDDDESSTGKLLEILKIRPKKTQYKRISILLYSDANNNVRIMAYDGNEHKQKYEVSLIGLDERGLSIYKINEDLYFKQYTDIKYESLLKSDTEIVGPGKLYSYMYELMDEVKTQLDISMPLVEMHVPTDKLISKLIELLKKKVKIYYIVSGRQFANELLKKQYEKLLELRSKYEGLFIIRNVADYTNKCVLIDTKKGFVSKLIEHNIGLVKNDRTMTEEGFLLEQHPEIQIAKNFYFEESNETLYTELINKREIEGKLKSISEMVIYIDEYLLSINGKGWIGGGAIPNLQRLLSVPTATTEERFENFANTVMQSLIEVLNKGKGNSYFFVDFKNYFPKIQRVLHKIRVYRNAAHHLKLDEQVKENYFLFLNEDLDGSLPIFIKDGYYILQTKLIRELYDVLYSEVNKIRSGLNGE
ncbi:hypothetical protein [Paenibacillus silvisoli]|uniref:hypothetical protein n=1 Tax=Paenibacillus silvisoli TaxID=3110539 RepID=UPI002805DEA5|nr:hypothetical protein [Paenibacillus silvisoli]